MDRQLTQSERRKGKPMIFLVGGLVFFALISFVLFSDASISAGISRDSVMIKTVSFEPFQELIAVDGVIKPVRSVIIDAIIGGKIKSKYVQNGAVVRKGQPILELENSDLQLDILNKETAVLELINNIARTRDQLDQNRINRQDQLADADYQLREALRELHVNTGLFEKGVIPEQEYLRSQSQAEHFSRKQALLKRAVVSDSVAGSSQLRQSRISLDQARKNLDLMKLKLHDLIITSPIDGQLSSFSAELGQLMNKGDNVGQVDVLSALKVVVQIDEHFIDRIAVGRVGVLELGSNEYELRIDRIYPTVQNNFFSADMQFNGVAPEGLKRGQNVRVKIQMSNKREAIVVPRGSFFQSTGGQWIYALDEDGTKARRIPIRLGKQNPYFYEVLDGLQPGTQVIVSSYKGFDDYEILKLNSD